MRENPFVKAIALFLCMLMLLLGASPAALASTSDGILPPESSAGSPSDGSFAPEGSPAALSDGSLAAQNGASSLSGTAFMPQDDPDAASDGALAPELDAGALSGGASAPEDASATTAGGNLAPEGNAGAASDGNLSPDNISAAAAKEEEEDESLQMRPLDTDGHMSGHLAPYSGHKVKRLPSGKGRVLLGFPSKFDLRTSLTGSRVTGVRDQGSYGTCWAFSAAGVMESNLLMQNFGSYDLSELQLAYFSYMRNDAVAAAGGTPGDTVVFNNPNTNVLMRGGNAEETMASLANRMGFTTEATLPYSKGASVLKNGLSADYAQAANAVGLRSAVRFNAQTDRDAIKAFLQQYGAATIDYFHNDAFFYNPKTAAYCCPSTPSGLGALLGGGHQVTLVGWDDTYAISNFGEQKPSRPGAWICKNSWGTGWGKGGYYYISYYDATIGDVYFFEADTRGAYDQYYQHDGGLLTDLMSTGWYEASEAAVFTAKDDSYLCAAGFFANSPGLEVTVEVYRDLPPGGSPDAGTPQPAAAATHKLSYEGYYTLPLARPVALEAGERFSVVLSVRDESGAFLYFSYDAVDVYAGVLNNVQAGVGESYFKGADGVWRDMAIDPCYPADYPINLRIKAMTVSATHPYFQNFKAGDLNRDGRVGVGDAVLLSRHLTNNKRLNGAAQMCADINADGQSDVEDMVLLEQYLAKKVPALPG